MNPEDVLKKFRLSAPADAVRGRALKAARRARFEKRLWRWTWAAAAAVLAVAIPLNAAADRARPLPSSAAVQREVDRLAALWGDQDLRPQIRFILTSPSPKAREVRP